MHGNELTLYQLLFIPIECRIILHLINLLFFNCTFGGIEHGYLKIENTLLIEGINFLSIIIQFESQTTINVHLRVAQDNSMSLAL